MSVAFTREDSAATASEVELPDRPVSPHPNLVTARGLALLEAALAEARAAHDRAQAIEDVNERRREAAMALRDLVYFAERAKTAQLTVPRSVGEAGFGIRVTFERGDGRRQAFTIVGEDEADPRQGSISYVSPMARALAGKRVGDVAEVAGQDIEILAIELPGDA
ncbi:transcription elongation factor [Labrys miyagiensis]|uniref:Transcription elongation factor n=1 Tax=Labrys miyagiensis TaxID=346912 RepID=A0ABQ6C9Y3_9HYPH|nr:transcription elongation factor GreA [Labrys miyagiensis]GLS17201.1 transcription elongation factor [Labrys miyagiensis]